LEVGDFQKTFQKSKKNKEQIYIALYHTLMPQKANSKSILGVWFFTIFAGMKEVRSPSIDWEKAMHTCSGV